MKNLSQLILAGHLVLLALLVASCTAGLTSKEPAYTNTPLALALDVASPAIPTAPIPSEQKLRILNQSSLPIRNLTVIFPDDRIDFGDVAAGALTDYKIVLHGAYRYAAYNAEIEGKTYQQPVVDWVGEAPMNGNAFTYVLDVNPSKWTTEGQVILLVRVSEEP